MIYDLTSHGRERSSFLRHIATASSLPVDIVAMVLDGRYLTSDLFPISRSCLMDEVLPTLAHIFRCTADCFV
jgi:hypothetical protein